ncbi:MAG: hypothetical protein P8J27_14795 [Mariniblastus sp.]|nr:hypothetical protein [Mariniblastus sp.]
MDDSPTSDDAKSGFQFRIYNLIVITTSAAIFVSLITDFPAFGIPPQITILFACLGIFVVFGRGTKEFPRMLVLLGILVPLEIGCVVLCYYTVGEIASALVLVGVLLNLGFLLLFAAGGRQVSICLVVLIAILIIPYQTFLGIRWWTLHRESTNIIKYATAQRVQAGECPSDLSQYRFRYPGTRWSISYRENDGDFSLSYHVGSPNTSHDYNGRSAGRWFYYPD